MKHHLCPTCGQRYGCPSGGTNCGSPHVYDCICCYQRRYRKELEALAAAVAFKYEDQSCAGHGDFCYAH